MLKKLRCVFIAYDMGENPGSSHKNGEWQVSDDETGWYLFTLPNNVDGNTGIVFEITPKNVHHDAQGKEMQAYAVTKHNM